MFTAHSPLKNKNLNPGIILTNDNFGVYNHTNANLVYAYRFRLGKGRLAFGLQAGVDVNSINWTQIRTTESGDPNFVPGAGQQITPQAGAGAYYHAKSFYVGLASPNLFNGQINPGMIANFTAGAILKVTEDFRIKPAVLVKRISGSPVEANLSSTFYYKDIAGVGVGYTYNNSAIAYVDIKLNDQLNFGYGYAYMLNELSAYSNGSHEVMLRYLFRYKINAVNARFF
jgi:type IX secretion system PorP/SprF family membrane protein